MKKELIKVKNISKDYFVYKNSLQTTISALLPKLNRDHEKITVLDDINFNIGSGQSIGLIGKNGSGKSTLLQILAGIVEPSRGKCDINGNVSAMLELGSGFNLNFSGRENIILNGLLLGLKKSEIISKFDEIIKFADIGSAIDQPVKTYSSGMIVRLAFAVQVINKPEILIIDEALSVGDFFFQQKCFKFIRELISNGTTLLLVSHDLGMIQNFCTETILLDKGKLIAFDHTEKVISQYLSINESDQRSTTITKETSSMNNLHGEIKSIRPLNSDSHIYLIGDDYRLETQLKLFKNKKYNFTIVIKNIYGELITSFTTGSSDDKLFAPHKNLIVKLVFDISLTIEGGMYSIDCYLGEERANMQAINIDKMSPAPIQVFWDYENNTPPFAGKVGLPVKKSISIVDDDE